MAKIPQMNNVSGSKSNKSDSQDTKNNNIILNEFGKLSIEDDHNLARNSSQRTDKPNFIEENHPIETEEWIVFLQKSMEEVMCGDLTSLTQPSLTNIIVSPLRNTNTSSKVLNYVTKLLSISFVLKSVSQDSKDRIKKVYLDVKLVPNLVYSSKQIMKIKSENSSSSSVSLSNTPLPHRDIYRSVSDLTDVDIQSLEYIYTLITHLVHLDNEFLLQLCDSLAVLNVFAILRSFLIVCKSRVQIIMDLLAIFTHILRVFPENVELIEKIILNETVEDSAVNFVELLRYNHPVMQERACLFLQYLGKYLTTNKIETLWNEIVRETLEALMYDSNENVRNAADKTVDELKYKEFYKQKSVNII
ncbi:hypothetical protein Zmor_027027 [Zophobas morio]|uniref:Uncharacterized protein n=1 Tax=Zophobas morio TaxID=2755281 RepID=A0AA38M6G5_9CUCU|nr:hypothetical protein Zmor_027027 [Zophobas morio]